ncbi:MAG: glycosyltransferase family 4 protein [Bacteroidia bacterium]|nr:glycosyltransferase family 4 protein [Bacteroidia bacterium]
MQWENYKGKIALLTDGITPWVVGGMQRHSYLLLKSILRAGWEVDLYHPAGRNLHAGSEIPGLDTEMRRRVNLILVQFPEPEFIPGHYLRRSFHFSANILSVFQSRKPVNMIIAKGFTSWAFLTKKNKMALPPVAVNFHGMEMFQRKISLKQAIEQWMLRGPVRYNLQKADYVFSYGGKITSIIMEIGVNSERIVELPAGVEERNIRTSEPGVADGPRTFVFLGRWERRKGIQELSDAIRLLLKQGQKFHFHFIGPVPDNHKVASDAVTYHGELTDFQRIQTLLMSADVLVCPSYSEGMPNSILEGMSAGLAILATEVGAVPVMVDAQNGVLLDRPHREEIAEGIKRMIGMSEAELTAMKRSSVEKCREKFNWNVLDKEISAWISGHIRP